MLQSETDCPYERLLKLYKEVAGKSPSKGQLPFSTDWFMTWQPNIHASLFYQHLRVPEQDDGARAIDAIIKAYQLYCARWRSTGSSRCCRSPGPGGWCDSSTPAWCSDELHALRRPLRQPHLRDSRTQYVCGLCEPPARAGKAKQAGAIH